MHELPLKSILQSKLTLKAVSTQLTITWSKIRKGLLEVFFKKAVFKKFYKIYKKKRVPDYLFNKVAGLEAFRSGTLLIRDSSIDRCFHLRHSSDVDANFKYIY